ncbi:MAG TPA: type II toxin-antitoxin system VapC family toxin [Terriglobales bacterium]|jgi:predicted nucleic acid-binding protein
MIYFDTACIAKCYLNEPGAAAVRAVARASPGLASSLFARLEFHSVLHRHLREGRIQPGELDVILDEFQQDEEQGVWHWYPLSRLLVARACAAVRRLPAEVTLRAGDALHLSCAADQGHTEIYTNDRHMLAAAPFFQLRGLNPAGE